MDWTVWNNMFHHHLPISLNFKYKTILHIFHHLKSNIYLWEFKRKKKQEDKKNMQELESQSECTLASTVNSLLRDTLISQRLYLQTFFKYLSMVKKEFLDNKSNVLHFVDTVIIKCTALKLEIQVYLISSGSFWRSNLKMMRIKKKCILKIIY